MKFRSAAPLRVILDRENDNLHLLLQRANVRDKKVADVGCGIGNVLQFLSQAKYAVGLDFTRSMLNVAKGNFAQVEFVQAKGQSVPFKSNSLDLITAIGLIEYLKDPRPFLEESARLLKRGGFLLISFSPVNLWLLLRTCLGHPVYGMNLERMNSLAKQYDFQLKDSLKSVMQHQILFQKL